MKPKRSSTWIIVTRNPHNNRLLIIGESGEDSPQEFSSEGDANQAAETVTACRAWGYEALEVNLPKHRKFK